MAFEIFVIAQLSALNRSIFPEAVNPDPLDIEEDEMFGSLKFEFADASLPANPAKSNVNIWELRQEENAINIMTDIIRINCVFNLFPKLHSFEYVLRFNVRFLSG